MSLHRGLAGAKLRRNLLVPQAGHGERHHLALALRQRFVPPADLGQTGPLMSCRAVTINRVLHRVEQLLVTKRLSQKVHRASLQGLHRHRNVPVRGDEHDLDRWIRMGQLTLKIEAAHSRKSHVQHKAARGVRPLGLQEFLWCLERLRSETHRAEKSRQGFTYRWIVVDDVDDRVVAAHGRSLHPGRTNPKVALTMLVSAWP